VDLRRPGRRNRLHRFAFQKKSAPGDRPVDRPPGQRLNPKSAPQGQDELFIVYRHHAVLTNSTEPMLLAEAHHQDHAIGHRRPQKVDHSALSLITDSRQRRVADLRSHRLQPVPRRRGPGRRETAQGPHHHDPGPADQHPRPSGVLRADLHPASPRELPPRSPIHDHVRRRPGTTPSGLSHQSGHTGYPGPTARLTRSTIRFQDQPRLVRYIQAESHPFRLPFGGGTLDDQPVSKRVGKSVNLSHHLASAARHEPNLPEHSVLGRCTILSPTMTANGSSRRRRRHSPAVRSGDREPEASRSANSCSNW